VSSEIALDYTVISEFPSEILQIIERYFIFRYFCICKTYLQWRNSHNIPVILSMLNIVYRKNEYAALIDCTLNEFPKYISMRLINKTLLKYKKYPQTNNLFETNAI